MSDLAHSATRLCRANGLHRTPAGWVDDEHAPVVDAATLARLRALGIPPAWRDVWASTDPDARVQATGVDARGRTQYRYSAAAEADAAAHKFDHLLLFGRGLPTLRRHVGEHLSNPADGDAARVKRVTAAAVRLLDRGLFRIGSERYARDNHTYGLTTLTAEHIRRTGDDIEFTFIGKEHLPWHVTVTDAQVSEVIEELLLAAPSATAPLFSVAAKDGTHAVTSSVVNSYIHASTTAPATAKTFRTWGGTATAAAISAGAAPSRPPGSRRADLIAIEAAAQLLGNTRAVARQSYVHPFALDAGRAPAVVAAVSKAIAATGSADVRGILHVDDVVIALADELTRLSRSQV